MKLQLIAPIPNTNFFIVLNRDRRPLLMGTISFIRSAVDLLKKDPTVLKQGEGVQNRYCKLSVVRVNIDPQQTVYMAKFFDEVDHFYRYWDGFDVAVAHLEGACLGVEQEQRAKGYYLQSQ